MLFDWCNDALTVIRPAITTVRGSKVHDWDNATTYVINGCSVQPSASSREFSGRDDQSTFSLHVFLPDGADIQKGDRIMYEGKTFEINGVPYHRESPTSRVDSVQVDLIEWEN